MITNNNFLAVLFLRHRALAGHIWGRGCVRSWAVLASGTPHPHPESPCPKGSRLCRGGRSPKRGGHREPWAVATPSLQLLQVSGVMSSTGSAAGCWPGEVVTAMGPWGHQKLRQGQPWPRLSLEGCCPFLCVRGHVSPEGHRAVQVGPGLLSLAINASLGRCPH